MKPRTLLLLAVSVLPACGDAVDPDFDASVPVPTYPDEAPRIAFDEGHRNVHASRGTYRPFVQLLESDGYDVERLRGTIASEDLEPYRVLVVVCPRGPDDEPGAPAFETGECDAIEDWVRSGGGLLLVTDAYPNDTPSAELAHRFGIEVSRGITFDEIDFDREANERSQLVYSRDNWLLRAHPVTEGRGPAERVGRVVAFTGQSLRGPEGSTLFLRHGATALLRAARARVRVEGDETSLVVDLAEGRPGQGWGQGIAFEHGAGRVVALGDATMLTALLEGERKVGMNLRNVDNKRLALNAVHWLTEGSAAP